MSVWTQLKLAAEMYLNDRAEYELQFRPLVIAEGVAWNRYDAAVRDEAKKITKARNEAEKEAKRAAKQSAAEQKKHERLTQQASAEQFGARHMQRGDYAEVADCVIDYIKNTFGSPPAFDEGSMWTYSKERGIWEEYPDAEMSQVIASWAGVATVGADAKVWTCNHTKTPIDLAKDYTRRWKAHIGFFRKHDLGMAFRNCYYTVTAGKLEKRDNTPANRCRFGFDFDFMPGQFAGSKFESYTQSLFVGAEDAEERVALLGEFFGLTAFGLAPKYNKGLIIHGPGGSGKGSFLRLMLATFPADKIGSIQPQRWSHGASLYSISGLRLNAVNEMNTDDMTDVGRIKAMISGDPMEAEPKYRDVFTFSPSCGHVFTVNPGQLPTVPDADEPFWQRWMVVPFDRVFRDTDDQQRYIIDEIIAEELHIVIGWLMHHAQKALRRGTYTDVPAGQAIIDEWRGSVNPVASFLAERTGPSPAVAAMNLPSLAEVFDEYQKWCIEAGHKPSSRTVLGRHLRALGLMAKSNGNRVAVRILKPYEYGETSDDF
jgi:P4 family phage/plasmid primase-like protien